MPCDIRLLQPNKCSRGIGSHSVRKPSLNNIYVSVASLVDESTKNLFFPFLTSMFLAIHASCGEPTSRIGSHVSYNYVGLASKSIEKQGLWVVKRSECHSSCVC